MRIDSALILLKYTRVYLFSVNKVRIILVLFGIAAAILLTFFHFRALQLKNWQPTSGLLEYAYLHTAPSVETGRGARSLGKDKLFLSYKYSYSGKMYMGHRLMMLDFIFTPRKKALSLEKGEIIIFVNPENPNESVLFIDYPTISLMILAFISLLFFLLGLMLPVMLRYALRAIFNS